MNVLLLFAFIATLFSVCKDLIDANSQWKITHLFSMSLSFMAFVPLIANLMIFITSDKNKWLTIKDNFFRFIFMDYYEVWLMGKICKGEGIYCNQSSATRTQHNGGKCLYLTNKKVEDHVKVSTYELLENFLTIDSIQFEIKLSEIYHNHIGIKLSGDSFRYKGKFPLNDYGGQVVNDFFITKYVIMARILQRKNVFHDENYWFGYNESGVTINYENNCCNIDQIVDVHEREPIFLEHVGDDFSGRLYSCSLFNQDYLVNIDLEGSEMHNFDLTKYRIIRTNLNMQLGILRVGVSNDEIQINAPLKASYRSNLLLNTHGLLSLFYSLEFFKNNLNIGIMGENRFINRGKVMITHCISLQEVILRLRKGDYNICNVELPFGEYYAEGLDLIGELTTQVLGETNKEILYKIFDMYFKGVDDKDVEFKDVLMTKILKLSSAINISRGLVLIKKNNSALKRFLVNVDYFFNLIGYGNINYLDKKINVNREVAQICRGHEKVSMEKFKNTSLSKMKEKIYEIAQGKVKYDKGTLKKARNYVKKHTEFVNTCSNAKTCFLYELDTEGLKRSMVTALPGEFKSIAKEKTQQKEKMINCINEKFNEVLTNISSSKIPSYKDKLMLNIFREYKKDFVKTNQLLLQKLDQASQKFGEIKNSSGLKVFLHPKTKKIPNKERNFYDKKSFSKFIEAKKKKVNDNNLRNGKISPEILFCKKVKRLHEIIYKDKIGPLTSNQYSILMSIKEDNETEIPDSVMQSMELRRLKNEEKLRITREKKRKKQEEEEKLKRIEEERLEKQRKEKLEREAEELSTKLEAERKNNHLEQIMSKHNINIKHHNKFKEMVDEIENVKKKGAEHINFQLFRYKHSTKDDETFEKAKLFIKRNKKSINTTVFDWDEILSIKLGGGSTSNESQSKRGSTE